MILQEAVDQPDDFVVVQCRVDKLTGVQHVEVGMRSPDVRHKFRVVDHLQWLYPARPVNSHAFYVCSVEARQHQSQTFQELRTQFLLGGVHDGIAGMDVFWQVGKVPARRFSACDEVAHADDAGERYARVGNVDDVVRDDGAACNERHAYNTQIFNLAPVFQHVDKAICGDFAKYADRRGEYDLVKVLSSDCPVVCQCQASGFRRRYVRYGNTGPDIASVGGNLPLQLVEHRLVPAGYIAKLFLPACAAACRSHTLYIGPDKYG